MSDEPERELIQLRALLASALGIRVDSNAAMLAATRRLRDEHEKWAAAIAETAVRLSDAGYHGQLVDSVTRLIADRDVDRESRFRWAEEAAELQQQRRVLWDLCKKAARFAMIARCKSCHDDGKELAALRASAVVLPEDAEEELLVGIEAWMEGENLAAMSRAELARCCAGAAFGVIDACWRPATVEAAPTAGIALADEIWPPGTEAAPFPDLAEFGEGSDA